MKISLTEYNRFCKEWNEKTDSNSDWPDWRHLRFGQAFFNYFKLQQHNAVGEENIFLARLYNEKDEAVARATINAYLIDQNN